MSTDQREEAHSVSPLYRPDIDGLRAIAVLSVVAFHAWPEWAVFQGGFIGVDVFFVISGFLISTLIFGGLAKGNFSFGGFYSRRIRRIFPALLLVLAACGVYGWFGLLAGEYDRLGKHVAGAAGFVSNFVLWNEAGYFDASAETKPLLHLWSLGIEEQFYIVWPLLLWMVWKRRWNFLKLAVAAAVFSFALGVALRHSHSVAAFYSPLTRFWELLVGSILAFVAFSGPPHTGPDATKNVRAWLGLALIAAGVVVISKTSAFPGYWALLPVAGTALIISAGTDAWLNRKVLSNGAMIWVGLISYPLYLWHWPLLTFARIAAVHPPTVEQRAAAVALSILLAWLTQQLVEKHLRFGGRGREKTVARVAAMLLVGVTGYLRFVRTGPDLRHPALEELNQQFAWDKSMDYSRDCQKKYGVDDYCNASNLAAPPDAVILGDSHANHFFWGLSEAHKSRGQNLLNLGVGGCPPLLGVEMTGVNTTDDCHDRMKPSWELIANTSSIQTVYLAFWRNAYFGEHLVFTDKLGELRDLGSNHRFVTEALVRTVNRLSDQGKKVVLIYDLPPLKFDIKPCFVVRPIEFNRAPCTFGKDSFDFEDFGPYDAVVQELKKRTPVTVFDTHQYLEGNFPVGKDGKLTYRDYDHLSLAGSLFFRDKF